jgi:wyosine [tRNA(Phe)-imidazoG37] synthetase (radical SAM superfamily)
MTHVFGPVPSRRLGRSLGVDLIPFKTCSYDCVYCQLGRTAARTVERAQHCDMADVLAEIDAALKSGARPDVITLSGSGEPTLYARLGELIDRIHAMTDVPVAVITNGSLLGREDVRRELMGADVVVPSLDAGDRETFERINRPDPRVDFESMVRGLVTFARAFKGKLWLEVLFVKGVNDGEESVRKIAAFAKRIDPDRVQLNTVVRPPADADAEPVPFEELCRFAALFGEKAEVIAPVYRPIGGSGPVDENALLAMVARRPCTVRDIAEGLDANPDEVARLVESLLASGRLAAARTGDQTYYRPAP